MPIIKKPLIAKYFNCESEVIVKFVPAHKNYSKKNNWGYWTEAEEYQNTHICDFCLHKLYKDHKWELRRLILNKKKRNILRSYIVDGKISVKKNLLLFLKMMNKYQGELLLKMVKIKKNSLFPN